MILKLTFSSPEFEQKFLAATRELSVSNVNISLINFAMQAEGLVDIVTEGEAIEFLVCKNDVWDIELISNPIDRIRSGDILEPASCKIKLLSIESWSLENGTWGQIRIANRYLPLDSNPIINAVSDVRPVEVIVMDSGINKNHVEFEDAIIDDLYKDSSLESFSDDVFHGTAVTSLIVGKTLGVYPNCRIKNVKIMGVGYKPGLIELGKAFDAILEYHNTCPSIPKVLNLSWIMQKSLYINSKLQALHDAGILIICAAGNTAFNIDNATPAGFANSIAVAASNKNDIELVSVYGINKKLSFYAPGDEIKVALNSDINGYTISGGSSFSCAFASAVAAQHFSLGATAPTNSTVATNLVNDCTSYALTLNENVSNIENKLLHNLLAPSINLTNNQYLGTLRFDIVKEKGFIFPIFKFIDVPSGIELSYSIIWDDTSLADLFSGSSVTPEGNVSLVIDQDAVLEQNTIKTVKLKLKFETQGLVRHSPDLYFFLANQSVLDETSLQEILSSIEPYDNTEIKLSFNDKNFFGVN